MSRVENHRTHTTSIPDHDAAQAPPAPAVPKPRAESVNPTASKLARGVSGSREQSVVAFAKSSSRSSFGELRRKLSEHPEQADAEIAKRLRGHSADDQAIVRMAVAKRGNQGWLKYADAEDVLQKLGKFDHDQRGDILGIMKGGASFADALTDERKALRNEASSSQAPVVSPAELRQQGIANVAREAKAVNSLGRKVHELLRAIGSVNRGAELAAGVGSAAGLFYEASDAGLTAVARGNGKPVEHLWERTMDAGELMAGGLTRRIAAADRTAVEFFRASGAFIDAKNRYDRAARDGDYAGMVEQKQIMTGCSEKMAQAVKTLDAQARVVVQWHQKFGEASMEMAKTVARLALAESPELDELTPAKAVFEFASDIAKDKVLDAAGKKLYSNDP